MSVFLRYFLIFLVLGCSSNVDNLRDINSDQDSTDDEESLFGSLDYPAEDTLTTYLTANIDNSRLRCEASSTNQEVSFNMSCYITVIQFDGRELLPTGKDPSLQIIWNKLLSNNNEDLGECTPRLEGLKAECSINSENLEKITADPYVNSSVQLTDGGNSKTQSEVTKIDVKVGVVAGAVASIPISYKVDDSIFASFPGENAFSSLSLNANQLQSGFQSVGFKVNKQNLLTDVTVSHITSACMREKKIYFTSGNTIYWIRDWTKKDYSVEVYSGASSVIRAKSDFISETHRMWLKYKGDQSIHCAPNGLVAVNHSQGTIWRLWDDGAAKHVAGQPYFDEEICSSKTVERTSLKEKDLMTSPGKALTKDFGCIGGVDIDPKDDTIYITNSHMGLAKKIEVLSIDYKRNLVSPVTQIETLRTDHRIPEKTFMTDVEKKIFVRHTSRVGGFKLLGKDKYIVNHGNKIFLGDIKSGSVEQLVNLPVLKDDPNGFDVPRGFYLRDDALFFADPFSVNKLGLDGKVINSSSRLETSNVSFKNIYFGDRQRDFANRQKIDDTKFKFIQSVTNNNSKDYKDILIAELDSLSVLEADGNITTVLSKRDTKPKDSCGVSVDASEEILPVVPHMIFDANRDLMLFSFGLKEKNSSDDRVIGNKYLSDYYDFYQLLKSEDRYSLKSFRKCVVNPVVLSSQKLKEEMQAEDKSGEVSAESELFAYRTDASPVIIDGSVSRSNSEELFYAYGDRIARQPSFRSPSELKREIITPVAAHEDKLSAMLMKTYKLRVAEDEEPPSEPGEISSEDAQKIIQMMIGSKSESSENEQMDFYFETPIQGAVSYNEKIYVATGLFRLSGALFDLLQSRSLITSFLTGKGNIGEVLDGVEVSYKIAEYDTKTQKSKVIYHGYPNMTAIAKVDLLGFKNNFRYESAWQGAWNLGKVGIDAHGNPDNSISIYVTAPYLGRVDKVSISPEYTFDFTNPPAIPTQQGYPVKIAGSLENVEKPAYTNGELATEQALWNPWDISVSDNGDLFVAEAFGGGIKRIYKEDDIYKISTVYGSDKTNSRCFAGKIEKKDSSGADLDEVTLNAASKLCKGDIWAVEAKDNCSEAGGVVSIYVSQNFNAASNIIELTRSCE